MVIRKTSLLYSRIRIPFVLNPMHPAKELHASARAIVLSLPYEVSVKNNEKVLEFFEISE